MKRTHPIAYSFILLAIFSGCSTTSNLSGYTKTTAFLDRHLPHTASTPNERQARDTGPDMTADKFRIMHAYQFGIEKVDGISPEEAVVIAQSEVIFRGYDKEYYLTKPHLKKLDDSSWAVEFYPVNKTFIDSISKPKLLITVGKTDGKLSWSFTS